MEVKLRYHLDLRSESRWNMITATPATKGALLYMQEVGDFMAGPTYYTTREGFDSFLLKFTVAGCGVLRNNQQAWQIPAGHFYWLDCRKWYDYRTDPDVGNWHVLWVHFYGATAQFYYDTFLKHNNGEPAGTLPIGSPVYGLMQSLLSLDPASCNQTETDFTAASLLTQIITECTLAAMNHGLFSDVPQFVQDVRMYLFNHFQEKLTLEKLGTQFGMNPCYLQKQFKKYIGQSPVEYQICLRMTRAKELMRTTRKAISEIAYQVGVDNLSYFTRQFKQQEGLTPQDYRRLWPIIETTPDSDNPTGHGSKIL
ncbi:MAG: AraC family transcriptional regulator [Oscillospiraceae bacterium]|nr:AraC family transcriptional regulator [Oscillospiraceae bacterium]